MKVMYIDGTGNGLLVTHSLQEGATLGDLILKTKGTDGVPEGYIVRIRRGIDTFGGQGVDALTDATVLQDGDKVSVTAGKHGGSEQ